jgi:hypothetical protein
MTKTKPTLRKRKLNTKKGINKDKEFEKVLAEIESPQD